MKIPDEPVLKTDDIQGDILAGFRKDHVRLVFVQFADAAVAELKKWLASFAAEVSTVRQVAGFNTVFRTMRDQMGREPDELSVLWRNISFTSQGLKKLIGPAEVAKFADAAFRNGAEARSTVIGDPSDGSAGDAMGWVIGSGQNVPDALVIIAADDKDDADAEAAKLQANIASFIACPAYVEKGQVRASDPGHEHFGYKDGISQPGVRGKKPDGSYFTPRFLDRTDPSFVYYAAPGQPLVWPGEFLLNLEKQKGNNTDPLDWRKMIDAPEWATNGSYLVFRRLQQDVQAFNDLVEQVHSTLIADAGFSKTPLELAGAMLVGRFKSGCPLMRSTTDNQALADDVYAANNFVFSEDTPTYLIPENPTVRPDGFPRATADPHGMRCPLGAHIRKVNPRDQETDFGDGYNNLQKRILRRGIPYGETDFDPMHPDRSDRGLLFMCYQASIVDQFEFLMQDWVNRSDHPEDQSGDDPLLSTRSARVFNACRPDTSMLPVNLRRAPIMATGAAYLFVPPISALRGRLTQ
jgi:Dyp-type peroxidase family